jgi:SAM-dependent methyltransferase
MTTEDRREHWDRRHERSDELASAPPEPVLVTAVASLRPGRALDLACGPGRHAVYLAQLGWDVTAVDYSAVALARLRERCPSVRTLNADLERGEFNIEPDSFELIVDCCFLHRPLFAGIRAGVRAGGKFVGVLPMRDDTATKQMNPAFLVEPGELLSYFSGWQVEHWREGRAGDDPARQLRAELAATKPAR